MNGAGLFFLLLLILVILPVGIWIGYTRWRAHKNDLPPPPLSAYIPFYKPRSSNYPVAPRSSGVIGWVQDKFNNLKNSRSAGGAYEDGRSGRTGFGPLDPDGAWDTRVGAEADAYGPVGGYEEQELGLHPPDPGAYGGSGYGGPVLPEYGHEDMGRGRSRSRDDTAYIGGSQRGLDQRYDEHMNGQNPFDDGAERSDLRGVSPRPIDVDAGGHGHAKKGSGGGMHDDSPTERKSMFREAV